MIYNKLHKQLTYVFFNELKNEHLSKILESIVKKIEQSKNLEATVIFCEKGKLNKALLASKLPVHEKLHFVFCKTLPFIGKMSLWPTVWQLKRILRDIPSHELIARGAFAGYVAIRTLSKLAEKFPERMRRNAEKPFPKLIVQTLELEAEKYRHSHNTPELRMHQKFIHDQMNKMEFELYRNKRRGDYPTKVFVEALTPALKNYLVTNFRADETTITIMQEDLTHAISPKDKILYRKDIRESLEIPQDAYLFCYIGSNSHDECPVESIFYFIEAYKKDKKSFLLVLTQTKNYFETLLQNEHELPSNTYKIVDMPATHEILRYVAACDAGLILRKRDIVNWVSRPENMLLFQSAGLKIAHNFTIGWLTN